MKEFKDLCWNIPEKEYRDDPAFSYSTLSRFLKSGFEGLEHLYDKISSPSLTFGSMVDTLMTDGEDAFNEKYFVATMPAVSDDFKKVTNQIIADLGNVHNSLYTISDKELVKYLDMFGIYQNNWKPETKAAKLREGAGTYYQMCLLSQGKEVVTSEDADAARACVKALKTSPATSWYFAEDNPFDGVRRYYQLKIKGSWEGIDLRCMIDLLIVDYKNKTIQPVDLKTSGHPEFRFYESFVTWNYNIQQALYTYLIRQLAASDPEFREYKILPYKFIVVNKVLQRPEVWDVSPDMADAVVGFTIGDHYFENWRTIAKKLKESLEPGRTVPPGIKEEGSNSIKEWLEKGK